MIFEKLLQNLMLNYERGPQFFMNSNKYTPYVTQMSDREVKCGDLSSLSLQVSGHGSFRKQGVATRFYNHLTEIFQNNSKIKKIKLKISGFDLSQQLDENNLIGRPRMSKKQSKITLIKAIVSLLEERISNLLSLQIRVSNVTNCQADDFKIILNLGVNQSAKQLTNLSCQFSGWTFKVLQNDGTKNKHIYSQGVKKNDHDRTGQPSLQGFFNMLNEAFENTLGSSMQDLKKFRLEISTWYYSDFQVENFFFGSERILALTTLPKSDKISQRIQYFHSQFKAKVQAMIFNLMPNLTNMQLDLRNWNKTFQMSVLKGILQNISNQQRKHSLSQISRRQQKTKIIAKSIISMVLQPDKKNNQKIKQIQAEEQKEEYFDFNIVI